MKKRYNVAHVLGRTGPLLLDFDGPLCAVFAETSSAAVAAELRKVLAKHNVALPPCVIREADPLEILRYAASLNNARLTERVDDQLRIAELNAIQNATPTPHAREVVIAANRAGRALAIVSNNAEDAIRAYLNAHNLTQYIDYIVGRHYADPNSMKPNPQPVREALRLVNASPESCALLGDSVTDIRAAQLAGVSTIGYANKPGKATLLTDAGADAVLEGYEGMALLASLLEAEATDVAHR